MKFLASWSRDQSVLLFRQRTVSILVALTASWWLVTSVSQAATPADGANAEEEPTVRVVRFEPAVTELDLPARYRLEEHTFEAREASWVEGVSRSVRVSRVTFPSPVDTKWTANNTVHCEYFEPLGVEKPVPGVVVLHILGGDFALSRLFCNVLAHRGVAALFLKMPYYGPRRTPGEPRRMISIDPEETVEGMTQAVLDIRRAAAWLGSRDEVDSEQLGVFGISLGGITGALAAAVEPRLQNVCLLLAGGNLGQIAWESPEVAHVRHHWEERGGTREDFIAALAEVDPCKLLRPARDRRVLMLNALQDEVIPRQCTDSLWDAFGRPEIVWYTGGHYSVAKHIIDALVRTSRFFGDARSSQP